MDKEFAKSLLPLVNDPENWKDIQSYANNRIEQLKNDLVIAQDIKTVTSLQGQIKEIKRLLTLRDEVRNIAKG